MRSIEDKGCLKLASTQEDSSSNEIKFEFHKVKGTNRAFGKSTPSKWDDAQKWLVNISRGGGEKNEPKFQKPRDSNADDRRLIIPVTNEDYYRDGEDMTGEKNGIQFEAETKNVDCEEPVWRINKRNSNSGVRDMGTEMSPIASQETSRTGTPIRATTPISSGSSTPVRNRERVQVVQSSRGNVVAVEGRGEGGIGRGSGEGDFEEFRGRADQKKNSEHALETRAMAWVEAERANYTARYKREEMKIQAWENHQKRKAQMQLKRMEVKAEQLKTRAQERLANKLASTRRIAEENLANAEAKLNEQAVRTCERADYIRRTGELPFSFTFKLHSFCW